MSTKTKTVNWFYINMNFGWVASTHTILSVAVYFVITTSTALKFLLIKQVKYKSVSLSHEVRPSRFLFLMKR